MKKRCIVFLALIFMLTLCAGLFACQNNEDLSSESDTCAVTFYENFPGGEMTTVNVETGKTVTKPSDPERGGYSFEGWFTSYDGGEPFDFTANITSDTQVFAQWEKTAYQVTYKLNNGESDAYAYVGEGQTLAKPQNPVRDQYSFDAWYSDADLTELYSFGGTLTSDIVLYAGWLQTSATVTFDFNYTGAPAAITRTVEIGKTLTPPEQPLRDMYEFIGWYNGVGTDATQFDFSDPVERNITLYARWERSEYIVTFNPNYQGAEAEEVRVKANQAAQSPDFSRTGYVFVGWYNEAACTTSAADSLAAVDSDFTVYAKWELDEYTVSFDLNYDGATGAPAAQTVKFGETATEPEDPVRQGYDFFAWYIDADCTEQFTFDMTITDDITLYAGWRKQSTTDPDTITFTFMYNLPGMGVYKTATLEYGALASSIEPDDPALEGYYFDAWYTEAECTKKYNFRQRVTQNVTLYARLLKQYTFEAELTNFQGKAGQGNSVNYYEEGLIASGDLIGTNDTQPGSCYVSNGYYVTGLYYTGAYLDFEITAAAAVTNAVIELRVSSECRDIGTLLDNDRFQIIVNGTYDSLGQPTSGLIQHDGLRVPAANLNEVEDADPHKTPFENCVVYTQLNLNAGANVIRLRVSDDTFYGGTFAAAAPIIDCMYIYSSVELTMKEYPEFLNRKTGGAANSLAEALLAAYVVSKSSAIYMGV